MASVHVKISVPEYPAFRHGLDAYDLRRYEKYVASFQSYATTVVAAQVGVAKLCAERGSFNEQKKEISGLVSDMRSAVEAVAHVTSMYVADEVRDVVKEVTGGLEKCVLAVEKVQRKVSSGEQESCSSEEAGSQVIGEVSRDFQSFKPASECAKSKGQRKRGQKKRQRERVRAFGADEAVSDESVVQGRCETVLSAGPVETEKQVPVWRRKGASGKGLGSFETAEVENQRNCGLTEAEKEAKDSLARRRVVENAVAARLAELKLRSLNDEKKCQDYEDLRRQRVIQWQNQALAKSQVSAKSLDPDSSVSMREFREQGKRIVDLEYEKKVYMDVIRKECGDRKLLDAINRAAPVGSATEADMQMAAEDCGVSLGEGGVSAPWLFANRKAC